MQLIFMLQVEKKKNLTTNFLNNLFSYPILTDIYGIQKYKNCQQIVSMIRNDEEEKDKEGMLYIRQSRKNQLEIRTIQKFGFGSISGKKNEKDKYCVAL